MKSLIIVDKTTYLFVIKYFQTKKSMEAASTSEKLINKIITNINKTFLFLQIVHNV